MGEISGYEIYYTTRNSGESVAINIDGGSVGSYQFKSLPADLYFFSMAAIDNKQLKSEMSEIIEVDLR